MPAMNEAQLQAAIDANTSNNLEIGKKRKAQ
jgi:hypothetical protein